MAATNKQSGRPARKAGANTPGGSAPGDTLSADEAFWAKAARNPFYRPTKTAMSLRIDSDVLAWLKSQGRGYQTRLNAILRAAMLRSLRK
jgi:uncharacterized protein (DUF4415 family)